ncbi:hypothetical protein BDR03DRAFT_1012179 [Suillus americanus]|nr:hypothetical protein BDR03DRAFT_1012179 [Suillus americanus]
MSPHLMEQLQERIIVWHSQQQKTIAEIAQLAGFWTDKKSIVCRHGKPHTLNQQDLSFITSILDANPSLFLDEIQEQLLEAWCDNHIPAGLAGPLFMIHVHTPCCPTHS